MVGFACYSVNSARARRPRPIAAVARAARRGGSAGARDCPFVAQEGRDVDIWVLIGNIQQLNKVADYLARCKVRVCPHTTELDLQEGSEVLVGDSVFVAKVARMDLAELFNQHQQLLIGEGVQANDRGQHVAHVLARKTPLRKTAAKGLVAKDTATAIFDGGGCAAHDDAQVVRLAL